MKFFQLPMGARFEYRGQTYTKSGPLVAIKEGTGGQQLMLRSAEVRLDASGDEPSMPKASDTQVSLDTVRAAFETFFLGCEKLLNDAVAVENTKAGEDCRRGLLELKQEFFAQLGTSEKTR